MRIISEIVGREDTAEILKKLKTSRRGFFTKFVPGTGLAIALTLLEGRKAAADTSVDFINEQDAANLYGTDIISRNPGYWKRNSQGGVEFLGTGDGTNYLLMLNGAEANGDMGTIRSDGNNVVSFVAHRNVEKVYATGATFWRHRNPEDGYNNLLANTFINNVLYRPGVPVLPVRFPLQYVTGDVSLNPVLGQQDAATRFGVPGFATADWTKWSIGPFGEAVFNGTGNGINHPIFLNSAELNGETTIRKFDGTGNITPIVAHRSVGTVWVTGGTVWPHKNGDAGWQNVLTNTINYYNNFRPGIKLFPARF